MIGTPKRKWTESGCAPISTGLAMRRDGHTCCRPAGNDGSDADSLGRLSAETVKCTDLLGQGTPDDIYATVKVTGRSPTITGGRGVLTLFWLYGGYVTSKNQTTTEYTSTATQVSSAECPVQFATDWDVKGTVTESTNKDIVIGQKVAMILCAGAPNDEPIYASRSGTKIKF
jgi:hypothetical protein